MLFNSIKFIFFFLPFVLLVSLRLKGQALMRWLTLSSFVFYALAGHAWFLIPMLITTVLDFYLAPYIAAESAPGRKKGLLMVSLCGNLGLLFYFKYSGLFLSTARAGYGLLTGVQANPGWLSYFDVILPAGISFYTFQTLSYVIDVYRGEAHAETNFWKFAGFVSFFPHLVAGPLTRHYQLLPALTDIAETGTRPRWREGVYLFAAGLSKKILLADRIAFYLDPILGDVTRLGLPSAWLALFGYALQIYLDFSAYSDMAIGLARLFGIELPQNFNSPYQALSPSDFWRRWHMTLSSWLRDYLYITLGGGRCSPARRRFNLMATMVLGGLWHGANWTFALWGFYHGLLLVGYHAIEPAWNAWPRAVQRGLTFTLACLGWVFFRARDFAEARTWFARLFGLGGLGLAGWTPEHTALTGWVAIGLVLVQFAKNASTRDWKELSAPGQFALGLAAAAAILLTNASSKFLYFQF